MSEKPVALVTGASRGIGREIALQLAAAGHDIAGVARTLRSDPPGRGLEDVALLAKESGGDFLALQADVGDLTRHEELVASVLQRFGRIDLLVNNAGVAPDERPDLLQATPESFDCVLGINLRGPFFLTQVVARSMLELRDRAGYRPKIVFITSISARVSSTSRADYCISKAGLGMAAQLFAHRLASDGIPVHEIRPGLIVTDMISPVRAQYEERIRDGLVPLGRWGRPEDIARAVVALAQGSFDYATGTVIEVSGGMNIRRL